jgi:hypothetical protein
LILIEYHAINHYVVASSDVMDPDWNTDLNPRSYGVFIQSLATSRYISDGLPEVVSPWSASFLKYDCAAGSVLGDLARTPVDELEVRSRPRVIFRVDEVTWINAIVRYLVSPREAGSVKTRLIPKLLAALNAEPDKVMFPAGANR